MTFRDHNPPPDQIAGRRADVRHLRVDGGSKPVHILHAVVVRDTGAAAREVREEKRIGTPPVAFNLQTLTVEILVGVIEVDGLVMGERLVVKVQSFDGDSGVGDAWVLGVVVSCSSL